MSTRALPAGTVLDGTLEVSRTLGEGGFGITYLAYDHALQQRLVLKEYFPQGWAMRQGLDVVPLSDPQIRQDYQQFLERFLTEARIAARLDHPNLVSVHRYFSANGTGYFAMRWADGQTLDQWLRAHSGPVPVDIALPLILPLLDGLDVLHAAGLMHRDIKPANIYLRASGAPMLIDFGAARRSGHQSRPLTAIVSPGYAPPEQYSVDGLQGPHTDVYAIGAVLYRMLTNVEPLDALARLSGSSRPHRSCVDAIPAQVPRALAQVVDRAMALDGAARFPDIPALRTALLDAAQPGAADDIHGGGAPPAPATAVPPISMATPSDPVAGTTPRHRRGLPVLVTVLVALAVMIGAGVWLLLGEDHVEPTQVDAAEAQPDPHSPGTDIPPGVQPAGVSIETTPATGTTDPGEGIVQPVDPPVAIPASPGESLVAQIHAQLPPSDLKVSVTLDPERSAYVDGEQIAIGFSVKEDAYAAVFVYSQDGSVAMLYPNEFAKASRVRANVVTWVGSQQQPFRIQIGPPYGTDLIHVAAFRRFEDLKLLLEVLKMDRVGEHLFIVDRGSLERSVATLRTRGMSVVAAPTVQGNTTKGGWGDALQTLSTKAR